MRTDGARASAPTDAATEPSRAVLAWRRAGFLLIVVASAAGLSIWLARILADGGSGVLGAPMLAAFFALTLPFVFDFCNALLGLALLRGTRDPLSGIMPAAARAHDQGPIVANVAIVMTVRNENPARAFGHLRTILDSLRATEEGDRFAGWILSDSSRPDIIAAEERAIADWCGGRGEGRLPFYRRRASNTGFKGGNIHDFCEREGRAYDLMLLLDSDSLMSGAAILRLVRIMQADPRIGILQSFAVGLPSASRFARAFQFGHRQVLRLRLVGAAWWQGDCTQFWGHDALIRVAPYAEKCRPPLAPGEPPLGGSLVCPDQAEIALMRRAGYEVRFLPLEGGSYEGNPPTLPDYLRRSHRWCVGMLQYLVLLALPGLGILSRLRMAFLVLEFLGRPLLIAFAVAAVACAATWSADRAFPTQAALLLYAVWMLIFFAPRLLGLADALVCARARNGGGARLLAAGMLELVFTLLLASITAWATTLFMLGLARRRGLAWEGQRRDTYALDWAGAAAGLWPLTAAAGGLLAWLAIAAPAAIPWFLPLLCGPVLAVPFALVTASPALGGLAARAGLFATPEELAPPAEVAAILPLLAGAASGGAGK